MNMKDQRLVPLATKLSHLLGDVVTLSHITQGYHWNVKGIEFSQMHDFFADIYEDVDDSIDPLAENIRKIGFDAPYLLTDFLELTCINEQRNGGMVLETLESLCRVNAMVTQCYKDAFHIADTLDEQGIADFIAGRIDMHLKWQWQLESSLGIR
jgi:starvation-inducible DNA-binding protein